MLTMKRFFLLAVVGVFAVAVLPALAQRDQPPRNRKALIEDAKNDPEAPRLAKTDAKAQAAPEKEPRALTRGQGPRDGRGQGQGPGLRRGPRDGRGPGRGMGYGPGYGPDRPYRGEW